MTCVCVCDGRGCVVFIRDAPHPLETRYILENTHLMEEQLCSYNHIAVFYFWNQVERVIFINHKNKPYFYKAKIEQQTAIGCSPKR